VLQQVVGLPRLNQHALVQHQHPAGHKVRTHIHVSCALTISGCCRQDWP
jgi:hypothetical protein